jgi:hypothetical protein
LGKAWKRRICDEMVKPLKGIQRVKVPPDECVAGTSVASVAIHRATGGCRSVHSKEAGREDSAPKTVLIVMPTPLPGKISMLIDVQ